MFKAPYAPTPIDPVSMRMVDLIRTTIDKKDDDFLLMVFGTTGTGKSMLMLHFYELFAGNDANIDFIGFDKKSHAIAMKKAKEKKDKRFCANDEANVNREQHAARYNQDLLDLYFAIRGLRMFHVWNNPSIKLIPREFIKERIKGFIFIFTKTRNKPRLFYYFRKEDLLDLYDHLKGDMNHRSVKSNAKKYAFYRGWFKDYTGSLKEAYLNKKESRMDVKVDAFFDTYGGEDLLNKTQLCKELGITVNTLSSYIKELGGYLVDGEDYLINVSGLMSFRPSAVDKLKEIGQARMKRRGVANITPHHCFSSIGRNSPFNSTRTAREDGAAKKDEDDKEEMII